MKYFTKYLSVEGEISQDAIWIKEGDEINKSGIVDDIIALLTSKEYSLLHHMKSERT